MKIYTRTGDAGTTSLVGGKRVSKASPRLDAYGTVDELNSHIGLLIAMGGMAVEDAELLQQVQNRLFNLGSQLATEPESKFQPKGIEAADVEALERAIDRIEETLPRHNQFILPCGTMAASQANVARTVARRAERRMVEMTEQGMPIDENAMRYINRLSDLLFVLGRSINVAAGAPEIFWKP